MGEKEFGYTVSKDYDKLWKYLMEDELNVIVGFIYSSPDVREVVMINQIKLLPCDRRRVIVTGLNYYFRIDKDDYIECLTSCDLTFIDPEPTDPNAIYYADGGVVNVGDNILINNHEAAVFANPYQGAWELENGVSNYSEPIYNFENIKWEGNRMTNVQKVCDKSTENKEN